MIGNTLFFKKDNKSKDVLFDNGTFRVVIIGCLAIAISLAIMCFSSIIITKNAVVTNLKNVEIQYMAGSISATIDARIEKAVDAALILANDPSMLEWIRSNENDGNVGDMAKGKMLELVRNLGYDTTFLTSAVSGNYWSCDSQGMKLLYVVSKNDPADLWFYNTLKMKKPYEININYDKKLNDTYVWINSLVGDIESPIAVTGVGMNLGKVIKDLIAMDSKNGLNNDVWLVDDKGEIYLSKNDRYMNQNISQYFPEQLKNEILSEGSQMQGFRPGEYKDKNNETYDVVFKRIKNTKWSLVVQIPRAESVSFLNSVVINTVMACILAIIIVIVMFNVLSKRFADPYKRALLLNEELERKINERTKELNEKNKKIQDSIDYAKIIQESILPSKEEMRRAFDQYFIIWEPRDTVGGDFYWIKKFDDGVFVMLGDCTGHGVPGALMTMAVNSILNQVVDQKHYSDPAYVLSKVDNLLKLNLKREQKGDMIQDGLDAGVLFISNDLKIVFSGAEISIFVGNENGITEVKGIRESIGSDRLYREKTFINTEIPYTQGMILYMATDGYKDQTGGSNGFPYGKKRMISLLNSIKDMPLDKQRSEIIASHREYAKDEQRRDDISMIGIRL